MAKQTIAIGTTANDGTGSSLRAAFDICNDNFTEIYDAATPSGANVTLQGDVTVVGHVNLADNKNLSLGNSGDYAQFHDGTNTYLSNGTGDFYIRNQADDKDIIFQSDDGSGGNTAYFRLDGSEAMMKSHKNIRFLDSVEGTFGNNDDLQIFHDGTDSKIENLTGDLIIGNLADDEDIRFFCDDGSGSTTEYFRIDGSNTNMVAFKSILYNDNVKASFGNSEDLRIKHDGTNSSIENLTGDLTIQNGADDKDIIFKSDDGSGGVAEYFRLDGSLVDGSSTLGAINFPDSSKIFMGTGSDYRIYHDGSNSYLQNTTGDIIIQNFADDKDIIFKSDDGSGGTTEYLKLDGSQVSIRMLRITKWNDNIKAAFGDGEDLEIYHDGSNSYVEQTGTGDLIIRNSTDDKDIIFQSDDGSGGTTEYFKLDGSQTILDVAARTLFRDSVKATFGAGYDLEIYHDGSNSYIDEVGTGSLFIRGSDIFIKANATENAIIARANAEVELYHNGSEKFATTSTGVTVTGVIAVNSGTTDTAATFTSSDASVAVDFVASDNSMQIATSSTDGILKNNGSGSLRFFNNGSERVRVDSSGNLGIGTTSPAVKLDVSSGVSDSVARFTSTDSNARILIADDDDIMYVGTQSNKFYIGANDSASSGNLIIDSSGNVGIGTTSPSSLLHLESASSPTLRLVDTTNTTILLAYAQNSDAHIGTYSNHSLVLDTNSTTALTIDSSQNATFAGNVSLADNGRARFGAGGDFAIYHNGTDTFLDNSTGDLNIRNFADDKDIIFQSDDGSGGVTSYIELDGSDVSTKILTQKVIMSNLPTSDPSNAGQLYNDSGVLKISAG